METTHSSSARQVDTPVGSQRFLQVYSQLFEALQPHSPGHLMGAVVEVQSQAVWQETPELQLLSAKRKPRRSAVRNMGGGFHYTPPPRSPSKVRFSHCRLTFWALLQLQPFGIFDQRSRVPELWPLPLALSTHATRGATQRNTGPHATRWARVRTSSGLVVASALLEAP